MKTIDDIYELAAIHPAIELGLKAISSSSVSKETALIEMVCHLADNLAMFKNRADMTYESTPGVWKFGSDAEPIHSFADQVVADTVEEPIAEAPTAEPFFLRHDDNHEGPKPDITFKDRLKDRIQPHRLPDLSVDVKKKRGWRW